MVQEDAEQPTLSWSLQGVRADGWLESILKQSPEVRQVADAVGPTFFAMACLSGITIEALSLHSDEPGQGWVEFSMPSSDSTEAQEKLPLPVFRERLAKAVVFGALSEITVADTLIDQLIATQDRADDALLSAVVGQAFVLLADIMGFRVEALVLNPATRELSVKASAHSVARDQPLEVPLESLKQAVRRRILLELQLSAQSQTIEFDLGLLQQAEQAWSARDAEHVIRLLGSWHMPLHQTSRTAGRPDSEFQQLEAAIQKQLIRAIELIALAYESLNDEVMTETALRTAIQLTRERKDEPKFLCRLADFKCKAAKYGEAIALYRRVLRDDGLDSAFVMETTAKLGICFAKTGRKVAALGCLHKLIRMQTPLALRETLQTACLPLKPLI